MLVLKFFLSYLFLINSITFALRGIYSSLISVVTFIIGSALFVTFYKNTVKAVLINILLFVVIYLFGSYIAYKKRTISKTHIALFATKKILKTILILFSISSIYSNIAISLWSAHYNLLLKIFIILLTQISPILFIFIFFQPDISIFIASLAVQNLIIYSIYTPTIYSILFAAIYTSTYIYVQHLLKTDATQYAVGSIIGSVYFFISVVILLLFVNSAQIMSCTFLSDPMLSSCFKTSIALGRLCHFKILI